MCEKKTVLLDRNDSANKRTYTSKNRTTEIKLRTRQNFELEIKNVSGNVIPMQRVSVTFEDGSNQIVRVDENGYSLFTNVPEGSVKVQLLDLDDTYSASHAANIKNALKGGKDKKDIIFESLKLPPQCVKRMIEIYDEQSSQSSKLKFIGDFEKYAKDNLSKEEKWACYALLTRAKINTPERNPKYITDGEKSESYIIWSEPQFKAIIPETKVKYYAGEKFRSYIDKDSRFTYQWFCFNDPSSVKSSGASSLIIGPSKYIWEVGENSKWKFIGNHTLCCRIQFLSSSGEQGSPVYIELQQGIKTEEAILQSALLNYGELPDPDNSLLALSKYIELLEQAGKMPDSDPLDENYMNYLRELKSKMIERFEIAYGKHKYPIKAVHIDKETSKVQNLRIFISFIDKDIIWDDWVLVDWSNVLDRRTTGVYEGEGRTVESAIDDIINEWDSDNRYPPGKIKIEIPMGTPGAGIQKEFTTDGTAFWDTASSLLSYIALGGAVVAGIVTLVAPVPGSRVVSFAIWTSIFASTASATINIAQRHTEGFGDFKENAIDSLTIVGNIFSGGWISGAKVVGLRQFAGSKMGQGFLIGQFATDGIQGVIIAEDHIEQYNEIIKIKDPHEKTARIAEFTRSALLSGVMTYVSLRGTKKDMELGRNFNKLKDPKETVDLTKHQQASGKTDSKLDVTVQDQPTVMENIGTPKSRLVSRSTIPKSNPTPRSSPKETGMPDVHFRIFQDTAVEEQMFILVRNTNPACTKYIELGYPAKPMSVKAKTSISKHGGSTDGIATVKQKNGVLDNDELTGVLQDPNNYVVIKDSTGKFVAKNSEGKIISINNTNKKSFSDDELGWVIDGKTKLPFTGDYDLQDVFYREGTLYKTKSGKEIELLPGQVALWDVSEGKKDITNPWIQKIKSKLNKKISKVIPENPINKIPQDRVKHGADVGFAEIGDNITVFRPDGTTELLKTKSEVEQWYKNIGRKARYSKQTPQTPWSEVRNKNEYANVVDLDSHRKK